MDKTVKEIIKGVLYYAAFLTIHYAVSVAFGICYTIAKALQMHVERNGVYTFGELEDYLQSIAAGITSYSLIIVLLSNAVVLLLLILFLKYRKKDLKCEASLSKTSTINVILSVLIGFGFSYGLSYLLGLIPFSDKLKQEYVTQSSTLTEGNVVVAFIAVGILAPIAEEIFFRGLVYARFRRVTTPIVSALISSLLFGVSHGSIVWIVNAMAAGMLLAWVFETSRSLYPCIIVHAVNNVLSLFNMRAMSSFTAFYELITVCSVISLLVGCIGLVVVNKRNYKDNVLQM